MGIMPQEPVADITDEKVIDLLTDQVLFGCRGFYKNDELDIKDIRIDYGFLENVNYPKIALPEINKKFSQLALTKDQIVKEYYFHNVLGAPLYEPVDAFSSLPVMRKISQAHQAIISLAMQKLTKIINHDLAEVSLSVLHKNLDPARNKVIKTAIVAVVKGEIGEQIKYLSENDKTIRKLILS